MKYTLGDLISDLEVVKDLPTTFRIVDEGSYRGYYEDAFIEIQDSKQETTAGQMSTYLIERVRDVVFHGYKGGEYTMWDDVDVYVASSGACTNDRVSGLLIKDGKVSLQTEKDEY